MILNNLELIELSLNKETFFEKDPFSLEDEYIILKQCDKEMSIGFDINVNFDKEINTGDEHTTPTFEDIKNVDINFNIKDFEVEDKEKELTPELKFILNGVLNKFIVHEN